MSKLVTSLWCPTCLRGAEAFRPGPGGRRPNAACPHCGSLERHRFLSVLLSGLTPWLAGAGVVVDVAPSRVVAAQMRRLCPQAYVGLDFDPAADGRDVDLRASVEALPFADDSVDFLTCFHVLEHVVDDRAAMREIARVLAPGGTAFVQVPWRQGRRTDEDPGASETDRVARFGQADHVRYYGWDFEDRLAEAGLLCTRFTPQDVVSEAGCAVMALLPDESFWAVRPARGDRGTRPWGAVVDEVTSHLTTRLAALLARERQDAPLREALVGIGAEQVALRQSQEQLTEVVTRTSREAAVARADADRARAEALRWESAYRRLRGRGPIRAMALLARGLHGRRR